MNRHKPNSRSADRWVPRFQPGYIARWIFGILGAAALAASASEPVRPELLPFGREGVRTAGETPTDGDLVLEVIFVDWPDKQSPSTDTAADFDALWAKITSNGELSRALTRQGFKGNLIVNVHKQWKRLPQNLTYYAPPGTGFKHGDLVTHSLALLGTGPFTANTIAVVIPDETPDGPSQIAGMSASAHGGSHHGIRSTILLTDKTYSESYTILLHEMGHSFGAPDLYPVTGSIHQVGGYGMMGDARGARHFLGWHKFRWGWLAADRTTLLNKQGTHDISLSGISNSSGQSMIVIPDPNVFAKLWVIECGQDIQQQADFKANNGTFLAYESDRLIVYTVEGNPAAGLRPIRLAFRTTPPDPAAHLTTEWLDAVSYEEGQSMAAGAAPFSLNVLAKTDEGFDIRITLATDLEGGLYNVPKDQFSPNGEFVLRFLTDGNVVVRRFPSETYVWDAINSGKWFVGTAANFHFSYENGTIKRINNATGSVIDQRVVQTNAPADSFLGVNDAGVIEVVAPLTLTSVSPNNGTTAGGTIVTLTGTNFTGATNVTFGGTAATSFVVDNATTITCTTPAGTAGAKSVLVTTPGGTNVANSLYTYVIPAVFGAATNFTVGVKPRFVAMADFNGDGKPDLAVANEVSSTVSILLGNGTGIFGMATHYTVGTNPYTVAVGDFNGDGKLDLATANRGGNNVSILLGNGAGGFGTATNFPVGTGTAPSWLAVGDFNGDGKPDLATANSSTHNVSILLGTSPGSFGTATNFPVGLNPRSVAVDDFNGDGKPDLVTANDGSKNVSLLLGDGAGGFATATNFTVGTNPISMAVGDLNSDGKPDLAVANFNSSTVSILLANGAGGFATATNFTVGTNPHSAPMGDLNGDGKLDLAVANFSSNTVSILLGTGTGSFGAATNLTQPSNPLWVAVGDLNGDANPDLVTANYNGSSVSVRLSSSPPRLTTAAYTGTNPTLGGGALYGFPIVSDTQSSPATLTITSTSAGTMLNGNNPVTGNNLNTGFRTNINLPLNAGQSAVAQSISLALGPFDDGLRLDYNGQTVLDFDFSNYTNISAVNSIFGGGWTPWTGEGAPIVLELDASGLRLMVTATSNGTGAAAGVLTGQRVNVLNYFTSDTYVPNPADPDFVSGVRIGLYNRNNQGAWAIPNATMTATARVIPRHTAQISRAPGGNPSLLFQCIASQSYLIQRSTDLLNWTTIQTATAAANGTLTYTDSAPPAGRAFYRIAVP